MAHPADDPDDLAALAAHAGALVDALERSLGPWVRRVVLARWEAWQGQPAPALVVERADTAATAAEAEVLPALRALMATDVDEQRTNPLALVRRAVHHATMALAASGVPPVHRDDQAKRLFPDDAYDLVPGSFGDVDPSVHEPGLVWGAAKAHVILRRRRADHP
ncbi:MAG: hypothetical protein ACLGI8_06810 [Acidimicrobiia bacterium]